MARDPRYAAVQVDPSGVLGVKPVEVGSGAASHQKLIAVTDAQIPVVARRMAPVTAAIPLTDSDRTASHDIHKYPVQCLP